MTTMPGSGGPNPSGAALWDEHSQWWKRTFTKGADPEYEGEIIPIVVRELHGCRRILDIGCGEGQVARALVEQADGNPPEVIGLDPAFLQVRNAALEESTTAPVPYLQGAGEQLPFADDAFDGAFCCLSIEHADDPDAVLAEVGRVIVPGGRFLLLINHPIHQGPDSGFIDDRILGERYWRVGPYLKEAVTVEEVDADVSIPFSHRPLNRYINPLAKRDLVMTAMFEPPPLEEFLKGSIEPEFEVWIPRLLAMRFERRAPVSPPQLRRVNR